MSYSDLPLSDALLIENGAYRSVSTIARTIEHSVPLAAQYNAGGLTGPLVKAAIDEARAHLGVFRGLPKNVFDQSGKEMRLRAKRGGPGAFAKKLVEFAAMSKEEKDKISRKPLCKIGLRGRLMIAQFLGVRKAYESGLERKQVLRRESLGPASGLEWTTDAQGRKKFKKEMKPTYKGDRASRTAARAATRATPGYRQIGVDSSDFERRRLRQAAAKARGDGASNADELLALFEENKAVARAARLARGPQYNDDAFDSVPRSSTIRRKGAKRGKRGGTPSIGIDAEYAGGKTAKVSLNQVLKMPTMFTAETVARAKQMAAKMHKNNPLYEIDDTMQYARGISDRGNPFGYDDLALVTNPSSGIAFLDSIEATVSDKVPVIGEFIAPLVAPLTLAAAGFGTHLLIVPRVRKYLPLKAQPFAATGVGLIAGLLGAVVYVKAQNQSTKNAALVVGTTLVGVGAVIDFVKSSYGAPLLAGDADYGDSDYGAVALDNPGMFGSDEFGAVALDNPGMFGAVALDNPGMFGDGMAYQLGRTSGYGFDGATHALTNSYSGASLADAYFSGPDFDAVEGEALLSGAAEFGRLGGAVAHNAAGPSRHQSNMAGRRFHRWGWLIKMIGVETAQKIAALPPEQRLIVIDNLRKQALAAYQSSVASNTSPAKALSVGPSAFGPPGASAPGAVGDAFGYGALAVADY
jgi:hypothetical protein